ncbi:MAG: N-6 DNA methylase [Candidatus Heimdallarchaeota archaeon]|nr:MAG: N-6 DNA methylase [Candidatus Heimdallarchaeota archaeon]
MSKEKSLGQYFTPESIADLMVALISPSSSQQRVLEPSAGKGIFLKILTQNNFTQLTGIEIDPMLARQSPISIRISNFFDFPTTNKFDVVIGNPPYIRWKHLSMNQREYFTSKPFWHKRMSGLTDILQPFIFKCVDHLKPSGELIFITPVFWMQTLHAKPLRRFLLENGSFDVIINFHETRIFPKVNLNLIIFKYRKQKRDQQIKVINYWQKGNLEPQIVKRILQLLKDPSLLKIESKKEGNLEYFSTHQPLDAGPWRFLPLESEKKLVSFEQKCHFSPIFELNGHKVRLSQLFSIKDLEALGHSIKNCKKVNLGNKSYFLIPPRAQLTEYFPSEVKSSSGPLSRFVQIGDVVEIGNGMVSGLDKAFRLKVNLELTKKETEILIPIAKAKSLRRYYVEFLIEYFLARPGVIPTEDILKRDFPSLYEQLMPFREALTKRYQYNRKIPYWEWVFLRNYKLMKDAESLICVPCKERFDKRGYFRFALCENGIFTTQDVTVLVKFNWVKESSEYITAFLNSKEVFEWVTNKGFVRGGVAEFSEEPLRVIPFRLIDWNSSLERKIHDEITLLVRELYQDQMEDESKISEINELISALFG